MKMGRKAKYFGTWWGGYSYSFPCPLLDKRDIEFFSSIQEAKDLLVDRYHNRASGPDTPCVSENCWIELFSAQGTSVDECDFEFPDYQITLTHSGNGAKVERIPA
jgi:hypothetical protein